MGRFTNPRDIYFGEGARHEVKNLKGHKAIVVSGGRSMRAGGFLQDVEKDLVDAGFEVKLFEGVESDPSIDTVNKGAKIMQEFQPDWIVAIGGGSPIDAAKAMWVFYEYPDASFDDIIQPFSFPELRKKAHFCAISSTSGTATEVTAFSVITNYENGIKYPLADFNITSDIAIVDHELTYSMPAKLCAHTGMDAMTHCLEVYVSTAASLFTDADALHGIREISDGFRGVTLAIARHASICMRLSVSPGSHSRRFCSALCTPWYTRRVRRSQAGISSTVALTPCTLAKSSSSMQQMSVLTNGMPMWLPRFCTCRVKRMISSSLRLSRRFVP